ISSLSTAGDYAFVTLLINGQPVTINPDGSFSVRVGLGDVTMALSAPGYLTAEKQVNLATGQADIDFGQINLVGGDSNGDNQIDIADLTLLLGAYRSVEGEQNGYVMAADFNRDGAINLRDLTLLGANFGKQGPQSW
uniref:dockerin type I domain-containing protein n=1 Tax=Pseudoalteromonas sp. R3 TaxID=1709477 RepID=UPI000B0292E0